MRIDQVTDAIEDAGIVNPDNIELYFTEANVARILVQGLEQTFYIVPANPRKENPNGFQLYHPWAVPVFPRAQIKVNLESPEELVEYLKVHIDEEPIIFLEKEQFVPLAGQFMDAEYSEGQAHSDNVTEIDVELGRTN